jgi:hypothetical protein
MVNSHLYDKEKKKLSFGDYSIRTASRLKIVKTLMIATIGINADQTSTRDQVMTTMSNQTSTVVHGRVNRYSDH